MLLPHLERRQRGRQVDGLCATFTLHDVVIAPLCALQHFFVHLCSPVHLFTCSLFTFVHLAWCCDRSSVCFAAFLETSPKTFPGEKLPTFSFGDAREIIQLWALCSLSPTPEIWLVPFPCERRAKVPLPSPPLSTLFEDISQFFSGAIACKIRRQAWKKSGWWWDTTDRIPFPPPEEKVRRETVTWMQRVPTIPSLLCDHWYPCILMRKGGEILSKYIVIMTVRLRTGLIGSLTNIQTRWAIFWQAFKLDGQWFAILEGGAVEQQEVASKCCLHQNQEKASYPPTHQR